MKSRVFVTRELPHAVEERLAHEFEVRRRPGGDQGTVPLHEFLSLAEDCDAIFSSPREKFTAEVIAALPPSVKAMATYSVGLDHIDLDAARQRGLAVFNTPGVLTDATADLTMLLLLGAARNGWVGQQLVRSGEWRNLRPTEYLGVGLEGKTLGIVGMGRIGQAVARRARGFGLRIAYTGRRRLAPEEEAGALYYATLEALLPASQILSLHCPWTPETEGLLNAHTLALLPDQAIVVNSARGALVVDEDLIAALSSGRLFAAGLDVFHNEPHLDPRYRELPNVYLLPHLGSATIEARTAMGNIAIDGLLAFFSSRETPTRVV